MLFCLLKGLNKINICFLSLPPSMIVTTRTKKTSQYKDLLKKKSQLRTGKIERMALSYIVSLNINWEFPCITVWL